MDKFEKNQIEQQLYSDYFKAVKDLGVLCGIYPTIKLANVKKIAGDVTYESYKATKEICGVTIRLATSYYEKFGYQRIKATLMHEIAHVVAFVYHGEGCGHDDRFQEWCSVLGGTMSKHYASDKFKDCTTDEYIDHSKWEYKCPGCGHTRKYARRMSLKKRTSGNYACGRCGTCLTKFIEKSI